MAQGRELLERAFAEDLGPQRVDLTAVAVADRSMQGQIVARQAGVVSGMQLAVLALQMSGVESEQCLVEDGERVEAETPLVNIEGSAAQILLAERTALNVLQRLSGVATLTRLFVEQVQHTHAQILDTRKTQPALRLLQRYAVRCGGGTNHRFGLFDEAMLKDNHIAACGSIKAAVARVRKVHPQVRIHVEADNLVQVEEAVDAGADVILLDNMTLDELRAAIKLVDHKALCEASGGVTLETVKGIAQTGVDRISVGAITHSAPAFDCALDAAFSG